MTSRSYLAQPTGLFPDDDGFRIPFGDWFDQLIDWCDNNLKGLFDVVEWPFEQALDVMQGDDGVVTIPRLVALLTVALVGYLGGGAKRAAYVTGFVGLLASMGNETWRQSAFTLYALFIVLAAIALGTAAALALAKIGLRDAPPRVMRAIEGTLMGWSWLHPFGLMLPAVFFFGIGQTSSVILATFLVLPVSIAAALAAPHVAIAERTRVGARASVFPVVLLLGIFAIMGMGGLGTWLFRALSNQDPKTGTHATLAIWLVGVTAWTLLGPWSLDHLPGQQARNERRALAQADQATRDELPPADITVPAHS